MVPNLDTARLRLVRELAPFAGASLLAWAAIVVSSPIEPLEYLASVALLGVAGGLALLRLPDRRHAWLGILPASLVFLGAVGELRNSAGGMTSGAGILALVPVFYTALHAARRRDMLIVLLGLTTFYLAPIVFIGAPKYPDSQYRATLLSVAVSAIIGFATQALVRNVRWQADEASARGEMLEQVSETVRSLFVSPQARVDVCEAAKRISHASASLLYEPVAGGSELRCTATSGFAALEHDVRATPGSVVYQAFRTGQSALVTEATERDVASRELWEAAGCPSSVLYEALVKDGIALGVLAVAWDEPIQSHDARATVAALLAHEAAAVIDRADAMRDLTGQARTDPLTGLPNRRAWDAELQRASSQDRVITVALLDLDHFKAYNDTYGHPAGDILLKETAAAWRSQLRPGDLLARIGGEEFALLLDCSLDSAVEVVERLRENVSQNRTASAGIAVRHSGESVDAVIDRADRALYEAKAIGRDRICQSV
jgi:diguanylate cyclase (GGDEF)-like protein